ncbi:hypothetical protein DV738_g2779, partial [Chaetothyriales sp. CBS 135597]
MALPVVKSALECADFSVTVEPYLSQFQPLASTLWSSLSSLSALEQLYLDTNPLISSFAFSLALAPVFLTLSEINKNYSQVDRVWSILPSVYIIHYVVYAWAAGLDTVRIGAVALASTIWSIRLTYNYWRRGGYEVGSEDYRWYYVKDYAGPAGMFLFNILFISLSQSVLLWVVTCPAYVILNVQRLSTAGVLPAFTLADGVAFGAFVGFVALTAVADQQQWNYYNAREEYRKTGKVPAGYAQASLERGFNTTGLFAYSRKPNYAFEQSSSTWITELLSERKYPEYKQYRAQVGKFIPTSLVPPQFGKAPERGEGAPGSKDVDVTGPSSHGDSDGATMADDGTEAFPRLSPTTSELKLNAPQPPSDSTGNAPTEHDGPSRTRTSSSSRKTRAESIKQVILNSNPPLGMWQATGEVGSKIPTLPEIRSGAFSDAGWSHEGQMEQRTPRIEEEEREFFPSRGTISHKRPVSAEGGADTGNEAVVTVAVAAVKPGASVDSNDTVIIGPDDTGTYPNGYRFPKKHTWTQSTLIGLKAFSKFVLTPFGFFVTLYGLNVVGWGAMIFFVLLKAAPAMCHPSCDAENSARKIWIEIDSQILNALFCVTAFGLAPWRFRDFYYLVRWRLLHKYDAHRRLAGLYRGWYRLPGSDKLADDIGPPPISSHSKSSKRKRSAASNTNTNTGGDSPPDPPPYTDEEIERLEANPAIPLPATSMPEPPLTGVRAPPSRSWTLDFVIWMYMANTILQAGLCGVMWAFNRHNRPSWAVGLLITLGCLTGIFAGILVFVEGSRVKKVEGIPIQEYDVVETVEDYHERKAREDARLEKKKENRQQRRILRSEKVKGHQWFTRQ